MPVLTSDRPFLRSVGDEPLPGYRLVAPLGQGGFGEVWKCVAPGGLQKAIKFVQEEPGDADNSFIQQEYDAFLRVKGIRHPFLLMLERVELVGDELVMVMELADESLLHRLEGCRAAGRPGIDRRQLLSYMVDIAEALDVLSGEHGLQHLDIKPANLFLVGGHVKVGDYGLVARFRRADGRGESQLGRGLTPRYVAPEVLSERVDGRTDQYSLALVYFELLTGTFPYTGRTAQQLLIQHASAEPDLRALPATDQAAVGKALRKSPADRFPTCLAFVKALLADEPPAGGTAYLSTDVTRRVPPRGHTPLPVGRGHSGSLSVSSTQRFNPAVTLRPGTTSTVVATDELALACPDLRYLGEGKASGRGRLIRAVDPGGTVKAVRLLRLDGGTAADLDDLNRVLAAPLPGAVQQVFLPQPRLIAVAWDAEGRTLRDWLTAAGEPSQATAARLLEPLGAILDGLHAAAGFAHLLLSASAVAMTGDAIAGVSGFGVGEALRRSRADTDWLADHPAAAPEALLGQPTLASDQYALALLYLETRRAWSPDSPRDRAGAPRVNWDVLHKDERSAVRRALATRPDGRFDSCAAFLAALRPSATGVVLDTVRLIESVAHLRGDRPPVAPPPEPAAFAAALVALAAPSVLPVRDGVPAIFRLPDGRYCLRFPVRLSAELATLKLSAYTAQHRYKSIPLGDCGLLLKPRTSPGGVELTVETPRGQAVAVAEMTVFGRPTALDQGPKAVEAVTAALDHFRRAMQNADERRSAPRWRTEVGVTLYPVDDELAIGPPVRGQARDVSATGFAVVVPGEPPTGHAFLAFDGGGPLDGWAALARVARTAPAAGHTLVAGRFLFAGG